MPAVKVQGELHCYNCGHIVARFEGEKVENGLRARLIAPANGPGARLRKGAPPRCGRCGGQVYLDEVEVIHRSPANAPSIDREPEEAYFTPNATATLLYRRY